MRYQVAIHWDRKGEKPGPIERWDKYALWWSNRCPTWWLRVRGPARPRLQSAAGIQWRPTTASWWWRPSGGRTWRCPLHRSSLPPGPPSHDQSNMAFTRKRQSRPVSHRCSFCILTPCSRPSVRPESPRQVTLWLWGSRPERWDSKYSRLFESASP